MTASAPAEETLLRTVLDRSSDDTLLRVVALIDRLPSRPEKLERLVSEARPRLRSLGGDRAVTFGRLLFLPVEGAICDDQDWLAGASIPRRTLRPIMTALRAAPGSAVAMRDEALAAHNFGDLAPIQDAALAIWRDAAQRAPRIAPPPGSGRDQDEFLAALDLCASVWGKGPQLWAALATQADEASPDAVAEALAAVRGMPAAAAVVLATLIRRASLPGRVASAVREVAPGMRCHIEHALDQWIVRAVQEMDLAAPERADLLAERFTMAAEEMEALGWLACESRRLRVAGIRQRLARSPLGDILDVVAKGWPGRRSAG